MAGADNSQQVDTQERRAFILELRRSGATYRQIAKATIKKFGADNLPLGFDCRYASMDVKRELEKLQAINESQADDLMTLELDRLDAMLLGLWQRARSGDEKAVDRVLRIMERRARLLGLDKAQGIDITSGGRTIQITTIEAVAPPLDPPKEDDAHA